ncbi:MAG: hypothetical protein HWE18_10370 [Gammaproteobacteria bacterium]|nr:hypothetical protein [Gammaproteobacteria bacterium]
MKKLIILAVLIGAGMHYQHYILRFFENGLFDHNGNPKVALLVKQGCGEPCESARRDLDKRDVIYEEVDMDLNPEWLETFGYPRTMPFLIVGKDKSYTYNPGVYSSLLAENLGPVALTDAEKRIYDEHFYADGQPKIVLYGTTWCGYCKKLRQEFAENQIDYLDYDVEKPVKKPWLLKTLGIQGYPTVYVGYKRVQGTDLKAVLAAH